MQLLSVLHSIIGAHISAKKYSVVHCAEVHCLQFTVVKYSALYYSEIQPVLQGTVVKFSALQGGVLFSSSKTRPGRKRIFSEVYLSIAVYPLFEQHYAAL